jgi:benzoyl-CoA reductase/2-hydroxyglutaryl-CoA dehydratase subunit BcrC/BadD/HgdB
VNDYLGLKKPCYFFYHPKASYRASSRGFYLGQLKNLVASLEKQLGPMDSRELKKRVRQGREIASRIREAYGLRADGRMRASNGEFYQMVRQGEFLHPDDFLPVLSEFVERSKGDSKKGPTVVLSGVLPNPPEMISFLDELEVRIGDDDLISCGRRLLIPSSPAEDPFEALQESYFAMPPCTTRDHPLEERLGSLLGKIERSSAQGVIFNVVKFCEPELFDIPQLVAELKKKGVATLVMDSELNQGLSGQMRTRIEAFAEMIA